jgi:hypothetical protein
MAWKREYAPPKPCGLERCILATPHGGLEVSSIGDHWHVFCRFNLPDCATPMWPSIPLSGDLDHVLADAPAIMSAALKALAADLDAITIIP